MIIELYILIGCGLLLLVTLFDKEDGDSLELYQIIIVCIGVVFLWPILFTIITKDIKLK